VMEQKFLPLGTVVLLKNADRKIMITGYVTYDTEQPEKVYDYCGCIYPEGVISTDKNLLFDHTQIEKVIYMGYVDEEQKSFQEKLLSLLNENKASSSLEMDTLE